MIFHFRINSYVDALKTLNTRLSTAKSTMVMNLMIVKKTLFHFSTNSSAQNLLFLRISLYKLISFIIDSSCTVEFDMDQPLLLFHSAYSHML
jgi:hypothetical protein